MESTVACVLIPRFSLLAATATRQDLLSKPLALAPEPGGVAQVGEVPAATVAEKIDRLCFHWWLRLYARASDERKVETLMQDKMKSVAGGLPLPPGMKLV